MRRLIISLLGLFLAGGVLPVFAGMVQDSVTQGNKRRQGRTEERVAPVVDSSLMRLPQAPDRGRNGDTAAVLDVRTAKEDRGMQHIMIDEVVAVIGTKMVKYSDVERALENVRAGGGTVDEKTRCETVESLMVSALYELQADEDSIVVSEAEVENELDGRIKYFVDQIGSREKLEEFYGKSIMQIKE